MMDEWYTVTTAAPLLGLKPNSLRVLAAKRNIGIQPGGKGTPRFFTRSMLLELRQRKKWDRVEEGEDRQALGLGKITMRRDWED